MSDPLWQPGASNSSVLPITTCAFTTSPLHIAASSGKLDICKLFCERIEMKRPLDARGRTPTYLAKWRNVWAKQSSDEPLKLKETIADLTSLSEFFFRLDDAKNMDNTIAPTIWPTYVEIMCKPG